MSESSRSQSELLRAIAAGEVELGNRARERSAAVEAAVQGSKRDREEEEEAAEAEDPYAAAVANAEEGDEGEVQPAPTPTKKRKKSKQGWVGADHQVWHVSGKKPPITCGGGEDMLVQINLSKEMLRPATDQDLVIYRKKKGGNKALSKDDLWVCRLSSGESSKPHQAMVLANAMHRTNLDSHVAHQHPKFLERLQEHIQTLAPADVLRGVKNFIADSTGPPTGPGTLFQYFARKDKITPKQIAVELRVIIWFIDAQIAFNQLDNPLFRQVLRSAGVDQPSSRTTIINTFLPSTCRVEIFQ